MKKLYCLLSCLLLSFSCFAGTVLASNDNPDEKFVYVIYSVKASIVLKVDDLEYDYRLKVGEKLIEPSHPYKEGYTFDGWYDENGNKWNFDEPVTGNLILYARYSKKADTDDQIPLEIEEKIGVYEWEFLEYLNSFGLIGEKVGEEYSNQYSKGRIIRHDFGNIEKGTKISYIVSLGARNSNESNYVAPPTGIN